MTSIWCPRFQKPDKWKISTTGLLARFYVLARAVLVTAVIGLTIGILVRKDDFLAPLAPTASRSLPLAIVFGSLGVLLFKESKVAHTLGFVTADAEIDGFLISMTGIFSTLLRLWIFLVLLAASTYLLSWIADFPLATFFSFLGQGLTVDVQEWMSTGVVLIGFFVGLSANVLYPSCWTVKESMMKEKQEDEVAEESDMVSTCTLIKFLLSFKFFKISKNIIIDRIKQST